MKRATGSLSICSERPPHSFRVLLWLQSTSCPVVLGCSPLTPPVLWRREEEKLPGGQSPAAVTQRCVTFSAASPPALHDSDSGHPPPPFLLGQNKSGFGLVAWLHKICQRNLHIYVIVVFPRVLRVKRWCFLSFRSVQSTKQIKIDQRWKSI